VTEKLVSDTGTSKTDLITSNPALSGTGDPNAVVRFTVDGVANAGTATASATGAWTFTPTGLADGTHTVVATETDGAGNTGTASLTFTLDTTAPTVTSVATNPGSGSYGVGTIVTVTVDFSSAVYVSGTPYLVLNDGGKATYASGTGSSELTFSYVVAAGQNTSDLAVTGTSSAAAFTDIAGNPVDFTGLLAGLPGILQIDTTAPKISSIATSGNGIVAGKGDLGAGNTVTLTVNFSENVLVDTTGGSPTLTLNDGGVATYTGGTGSSALTFAYTVTAGQNVADLAMASTNALSLNGASIKDAAGNVAVLTAANAYNPAGTLQIDTTSPLVTAKLVSDTGVSNTDLITSNGALSGTGDASAVVQFTVDGVASSTTATANSAGAWTFTPTGLANGSHTIVATETDGAGNTGTASLTFTLDTTAPTVTAVTANPTDADLDAGSTVTLTVNFSENILVSGSPYLTLSDGGKATYVSGSGGNALTFTYTVAAGQNTADLTVTGLATNGGTILDIAGNKAVLTGAVANPAGILQIDTTAPKIVSIATSGAGITAGKGDLDAGSIVTLTVNFGENVIVDTTAGTPTLALNDGGVATYSGGSGSSALTFTYVVGSGQNVADLAMASTNALNLNGGSITDGAGNAAVLTAANGYNPAGTLQIDTTPPTITSVVGSPASGEVVTGHLVTITLNASETVTVTGTPELLLNDGAIATYDAAKSSAKAMVFDYTVAAGDVSTNLAVSGIELPSNAAITDLAGNDATLTGAAANLGVHINTTSTGAAGPGTGNFTLAGGADAELFGASAANVTFASDSTGTLKLDAASAFSGTVAGLALGNYIDLSSLAYQGNGSPTYSSTGPNTGTLAVTQGTNTINIALLGSYLANSFVASSDGHGGTLVTDPPPPPPVMLAPLQHA